MKLPLVFGKIYVLFFSNPSIKAAVVSSSRITLLLLSVFGVSDTKWSLSPSVIVLLILRVFDFISISYVEQKNFSQKANEEMRLYNMTMKANRLELLKATIGLETVAGFDEMERYYSDKLNKRTLDEFARQAGILGMSVANKEKQARSIVNASFHNANFSQRIWMHQDLLWAELSKLLQTGLIQGRNPRVLARDLRAVFGSSMYDAERLLRTELARVQMDDGATGNRIQQERVAVISQDVVKILFLYRG